MNEEIWKKSSEATEKNATDCSSDDDYTFGGFMNKSTLALPLTKLHSCFASFETRRE